MRVFSLLVFISASAFATPTKWDSVAVFHRPEKILIQINEGGENSRLQNFMNALKAEGELLLVSPDQSFRMDCARNATAVNCALKLVPSSRVIVTGRAVSAKYALMAIGVEDPTITFDEISFLNSNGDHLRMKIADGNLELFAGKK